MNKINSKLLSSILCLIWMSNTASAISFPPVPLPAPTYAKQEKKVEQKTIQPQNTNTVTKKETPQAAKVQTTQTTKQTQKKESSQNPYEITLTAEDLPEQKIQSKKITKVDDPLFETDKEELSKIFNAQKKQDKEDLDKLWYATLDRNSAIRFAVQKLSIPPEQLKSHSSIMARSISTLISGAALVPYMLGAGYTTQTLSLAGGQLASRLVEKSAMPKKMPLTDTELIQLSELVENLQNRIIKNYYGYKSSINELKNCRQKMMVEHRNYSNAIEKNDSFYIVVSSALYDEQLLEEVKIKQKIKQYRLELERLAGAEAVSSLNLNAVVYNNQSDEKSDVK